MQAKGMSLDSIIEKLQILQKAGHGDVLCRIAVGDEDSLHVKHIDMGDVLDADQNEIIGSAIWFSGH